MTLLVVWYVALFCRNCTSSKSRSLILGGKKIKIISRYTNAFLFSQNRDPLKLHRKIFKHFWIFESSNLTNLLIDRAGKMKMSLIVNDSYLKAHQFIDFPENYLQTSNDMYDLMISILVSIKSGNCTNGNLASKFIEESFWKLLIGDWWGKFSSTFIYWSAMILSKKRYVDSRFFIFLKLNLLN